MKQSYVFLMEKLKGDYLAAYKQVELYSLVDSIDGDTQNEMMTELLDIMLEAQENEKPVEMIVGADIEEFCKSFFSGQMGPDRWIKSFRDSLYRLSWIMIIIQLAEVFFSESGNPLLQPSDITGFFTGAGGAIIFTTVFSYLVKPVMFRWRRMTSGLFIVLSLAGSLFLSFGLLALVGDAALEIPNWVAILIPVLYVMVFKIIRATGNYKDHGNIWRQKEPGEQSFMGMVKDEVERELPNELPLVLDERFAKINKKRTCRGKETMTPQEYTEKIRREVKFSQKIWVPVIVLLTLYLLCLVVKNTMENGVLDSVAFIVVLMIAEIPAMIIFWASHKGDRERIKLLEECDQRGITLPEYARELREEKEKNKQSEG